MPKEEKKRMEGPSIKMQNSRAKRDELKRCDMDVFAKKEKRKG